MNNYSTSEEFCWSFPEVNPHLSLGSPSKYETENKLLKLELEQLREEYLGKTDLANRLITELKQSASLINAELMEIMRDIIHKLTYSLIQKEVSADSQLLNTCVETLINFIPYKNGLVTVYLSPEDMVKIHSTEDKALIVQADPDLHSGDIVVKSNGAEIRALLSERIDLLIREQHDKP